MNPDYDMALYQWQDEKVEIIPKHMDNRVLGYLLEAAGDLFRELTGREHPDGGYIGEKIGRLERYLGNPVDVEDLVRPLSEKDEQRRAKLVERWLSLRGLSDRLKAVRDLNLSLADQNVPGVKRSLRSFVEELERDAAFTKGRERYGLRRDRRVLVRGHPRRKG